MHCPRFEQPRPGRWLHFARLHNLPSGSVWRSSESFTAVFLSKEFCVIQRKRTTKRKERFKRKFPWTSERLNWAKGDFWENSGSNKLDKPNLEFAWAMNNFMWLSWIILCDWVNSLYLIMWSFYPPPNITRNSHLPAEFLLFLHIDFVFKGWLNWFI